MVAYLCNLNTLLYFRLIQPYFQVVMIQFGTASVNLHNNQIEFKSGLNRWETKGSEAKSYNVDSQKRKFVSIVTLNSIVLAIVVC